MYLKTDMKEAEQKHNFDHRCLLFSKFMFFHRLPFIFFIYFIVTQFCTIQAHVGFSAQSKQDVVGQEVLTSFLPLGSFIKTILH